MNSKYNLIALDLDGTLTTNDNRVLPATYNALIAAQKAGVKVVLVSGRPTYGILSVAKGLQLDEYGGYVISYNGAKITACRDGEILTRQTIELGLLPRLYEIAKGHGLSLLSFCFDHILTETPNHQIVLQESHDNTDMQIKGVDNLLSAVNRPPFKCEIIGEQESVESCLLMLKQELGDKLNFRNSKEGIIEVVPSDVDKGRALSFLLQDLGINRDTVIAVGDSYNDISMMQLAGLGVAMANATEAVKQCADYVTKSNEEGGIEHLIDKYILSPIETDQMDLEIFNSMTKNTLMESLGIICTKMAPGYVEATMPVDHRTRQPMGILHGGASLALAETVAGYGSVMLLGEQEIQVGMQVSGNHISSAHVGETVTAKAQIIHQGRSSHVWNVDIITTGEKLISTVRVVNSILKKR